MAKCIVGVAPDQTGVLQPELFFYVVDLFEVYFIILKKFNCWALKWMVKAQYIIYLTQSSRLLGNFFQKSTPVILVRCTIYCN